MLLTKLKRQTLKMRNLHRGTFFFFAMYKTSLTISCSSVQATSEIEMSTPATSLGSSPIHKAVDKAGSKSIEAGVGEQDAMAIDDSDDLPSLEDLISAAAVAPSPGQDILPLQDEVLQESNKSKLDKG